jgi:hypothetical protein
LKLLGANAAAPIVRWIYETSTSLLSPFGHAFPTVASGRVVIEFTTLFAILIFALIQYFIVRLVVLASRRPD